MILQFPKSVEQVMENSSPITNLESQVVWGPFSSLPLLLCDIGSIHSPRKISEVGVATEVVEWIYYVRVCTSSKKIHQRNSHLRILEGVFFLLSATRLGATRWVKTLARLLQY